MVKAMTKYTSIESEFATSKLAEEHDAWVQAKISKALASTEPVIPHDQVMQEMAALL